MAPTLPERIAAKECAQGPSNILLIFAACALLWGCASPGAPVTRRTRKPKAVRDLAGKQSGSSIVLSFTLPAETTRGEAIGKPPEILIYRAFEAAGTALKKIKPRLEVTIPSTMVPQYSTAGHVIFSDVFTAKDLAARAGADAVYVVRVRNEKSTSAASNLLRMRILPVPEATHDLTARIIGSAVKLSWSAPAIAPASQLAAPLKYEIYRAVVSNGNSAESNAAGQAAAATAVSASEPELIGESRTTSYIDTAITPGQRYEYSIRTVAEYATGSVESAESNLVRATVGANERPKTPTNIAIAITPDTANGSAVALSWAISHEAGVAGYNVYRSRLAESEGKRLNATPILVPVFRDVTVAPGEQYFYRVTAINRAGDESELSAPVSVKIPASH